ncbi:hypothetical protein NK983_34675, partial [Salmonella enterica subsp. enterica serovar Typhimurium]|nr:hypothetical protein [Salmonella enterica subsp. enterica serovar Typhimurium]
LRVPEGAIKQRRAHLPDLQGTGQVKLRNTGSGWAPRQRKKRHGDNDLHAAFDDAGRAIRTDANPSGRAMQQPDSATT